MQTKERELELGDSLSAFMRELDMVPTGGRWGSITRLKEQMKRLFAGVHVDAGISGKSMEKRQGLQKALAETGKGMALVVYSLSRLARSTKDTLAISERLDKQGADLVIVLLMHDGFVTTRPIDARAVERRIFDETGYRLELAGGVIELPADLEFSKL